MKFDDKFNSITEAYLKIPGKRLMYPRGLELSEEFRNAYRAEVVRLAEAGQCPGKLCERVNKALLIHYNEHRDQLNEIAGAVAGVARAAGPVIKKLAPHAKEIAAGAATAAGEKAGETAANRVADKVLGTDEEEVDEGYAKKKKASGIS